MRNRYSVAIEQFVSKVEEFEEEIIIVLHEFAYVQKKWKDEKATSYLFSS